MHRRFAAVAAIGAAASLGVMGLASITTGALAADQPVVLSGSLGAYARPAAVKGHVEAGRAIDVQVHLKLRNAGQAQAVADAVSNPASPSYRHYLTTAQWNRQFAPSASSVAAVRAWLQARGLKVGAVPSNNLYVPASGNAAQVERAFGTTLNDYSYKGKTVRAAASDISVGASIAGVINGVVGLDDVSAFTHPNLVRDGAATTQSTPTFPGGGPYPPPAGFRNAPPCSQSYGAVKDTTDPAFGGGFPANPPYTVCGYTPPQLRQAYGMDAAVNAGNDGAGQTVAIIDAYDSATIAVDAMKYAAKTDPTHPFELANFTNVQASSYAAGHPNACNAPLWSGEQTLDVEAVHAMAPGAHITYVAAHSCFDTDLLAALNKVVSGHLAQIVSNSYGNLSETVPKYETPAYTEILEQAAATGIGVYFSSGDNADEFFAGGTVTPDFPATLPGVTAVGGTSLAASAASAASAGAAGAVKYGFETGWETGKSYLCTALLISAGLPACAGAKVNSWQPPAPGFLVYGSGGGTSRLFPQPAYQKGVVPDKIAEMNGPTPMRAIPDVAAVGDPSTGMLVGQTQIFPNGTYWDVYRIGGTSLSSPIFAGIMALADQMAGDPAGFANPALYALAGSSAFHDTLPNDRMSNVRVDYLNGTSGASGVFHTQRTFGYQGPETSPTGVTQNLTLHAAPGWDNETGNGSPNGMAFLRALS